MDDFLISALIEMLSKGEEMMAQTCSHCKTTLRWGSKFCGYCGTPVAPEERRCRKYASMRREN
ncbi:MAG TPA: zinc ribbon domain-containing protein [Clostridia bacterium]|nr:zinc ribbon domain-containing protein [Clostridia bacterium]